MTLIPLLERYFGRVPARPGERPSPTPEPEQRGERSTLIEFPAQPLLAIGWRVPGASHQDAPAIEVAIRLLGAARSSRLERRLIRDDPLCARVFVENGWPGDQHSNLAYVLAVPLEGAALEDIEAAILEDLGWLGLRWETPVRRQSAHMADYRSALDVLDGDGLLYPCFCTRKDLRAQAAGATLAPHGPDGPLYRGICRALPPSVRVQRIASGSPYALRLDMKAAAARASRPARGRSASAAAANGSASTQPPPASI